MDDFAVFLGGMILLILVSGMVSALSCSMPAEPFLSDTAYMRCIDGPSNASCYVLTKEKSSSDYVSFYPENTFNGTGDRWSDLNGTIVFPVELSTLKYFEGITYSFEAYCITASEIQNSTGDFVPSSPKPPSFVATWGAWTARNTSYLCFGLLGAFLLLAGLGFMWKTSH